MPITAVQANEIAERVTIPFYDADGRQVGDLNVTYRPNLLSRSEFRKLQEIANEGEQADDNGLAPLLSRCIVGWDFLQEDGTPYPIDADSLGLLGYPIQMRIVREMLQVPDPTTRNGRGRSSAVRRILPPIESSSYSSPATSEERSLSSY